MRDFEALVGDVKACRVCAEHLSHDPRPVFQIAPKARILLASQAPGRKVHETGMPFNDASGERLRDWLGVSREVFYDPAIFAIVPMGLCFPGTAKSGDLPPRPECAPTWRRQLLGALTKIELTLAVGRYAQIYHFGDPKISLTERVRAFKDSWPDQLALPHPSPRNNLWLRRNPWFEDEVVPLLRRRIAAIRASHPRS